MRNKILKLLCLTLISYVLMLLFIDIHKRYKHYRAVERFDQIENILRKGQKIDLQC